MGHYLSTNPLNNLHRQNDREDEKLSANEARMRLTAPPYIGGIIDGMKRHSGDWHSGTLIHNKHTRGELIFYEWLARENIDLDTIGITDQIIAFYSYSSGRYQYEAYCRYLNNEGSTQWGDNNYGPYWLTNSGFYGNDRDQVAFVVPVAMNEIFQYAGSEQLSSIGWALWKVTRDFKGKVGCFKESSCFACSGEGDAVILSQICDMIGVLTSPEPEALPAIL